MKTLKFGLRFWITITSVLSFVGGWIMLAHAPKPATLFPQVAPTLEALPPLFSDSNNVQSQSFFSVQPRQRFGGSPFFRTGGS